MAAILAEWETFARTLHPAADGLAPLALRDHAQQILEAVAKDIATSQSREAEAEKSKGRSRSAPGAPETAAQTHAFLRAKTGFNISQLVAEYRALRASVIRLWLDASALGEPGLDELLRFNEGIDQAIAESVEYFQAQVDRSRNLLLGMLGHDMRSPLNTIVATARHLSALKIDDQVSVAASRLIRSGASMQALLDDLVDFDTANLGLGIRVSRTHIDLAAVISDEVEQLRWAHPDRRIELTASGNAIGAWDGARMQQLLRNLVVNALHHGTPGTPVHVTLRAEEADVRLEVTNTGPAIDPSDAARIFDPLTRLRSQASGETSEHGAGLGLGLFIVREIAKAHSGDVEVRSNGGQTTFTVRLPRGQAASIR